MDGVASVFVGVEQFRAMGPLLSIIFLAAAAIFLTYNFVQSRRNRSSNAAHVSPVTEKDRKVNKNREPGGTF
jgi:predicted lipid-binding transport protein (Tim44 family)